MAIVREVAMAIYLWLKPRRNKNKRKTNITPVTIWYTPVAKFSRTKKLITEKTI